MTEDEKKAAGNLAVAYEAFWRAMDIEDQKRNRTTWNAVYCWAYMLQQAQNDTGVVLIADVSLEDYKDRAKREMAKIDAVMSGAVHEDGIPPHDKPIPQPSNRVRVIREKMGLWLIRNEDGSERTRRERYNEAVAYCDTHGLEVLSVSIADANMASGVF